MKILILATTKRRAGATFYARKLADQLGASIASVEQPLPRLIAEVWRSRPDIIHLEVEYATFGSVARTLVLLPLVIAVCRFRAPVVITLHGVVTRDSLGDFRFPGLVGLAFRLSYALASAFASAVTVHSEVMRVALQNEYRVRDATVIPLGADSSPAVPRRPQRHHLVFFGFVRPSKGLEELIRAVGQLRDEIPDLRVTVAGGLALDREAGYLATLQAEAAKTGCSERITFRTGFLPEEEKAEIASSAEAIVLPYTDRYAEISAVVHDFMGYGVPMIVSNRPRFSELEQDRDCLKVEPEPAPLASAIRRLLGDPSLEDRIASALRLKGADMSWDRTADRHRAVYQRLVSDR